jgi:AcrR family transcriptional regulator
LQKPVDRRVLRTRNALRAALLSLLRRKSYDDITVQDLIDEANVGRSTFYAHCRGKEDLLRLGLNTLRAELAESPAPARRKPKRGFSFSLRILEHVAENRDAYPALGRSRGRDVMVRELRLVVLELLRDELDAVAPDVSLPREITEQLVVGAYMSILVYWLEQKPKYTPAQIDAFFQRFLETGVASMSTRSPALKARASD